MTTTINGTTGVVTDGLTVDTSTIYVDATNDRVGIGTTSPTTGKVVISQSNSVQPAISLPIDESTIQGPSTNTKINMGGNLFLAGNNVASLASYGASGYINFLSNGANERMRIDSSGNLLVGLTSFNGARISVYGTNTTYGTYEWSSPKGSNNSHMHYGTNGDWYIRPASNSGSVYVKNYVAESDERLKTNIEPINYGLNDVLALQPKKFNWIDGGNIENNGFIAQEVESVIPALVSEGQWKSVDYQGITAILVKAIQEQQELIKQLQLDVSALKEANNV